MIKKLLFGFGLLIIILGVIRNDWPFPKVALFLITSLAFWITVNDFSRRLSNMAKSSLKEYRTENGKGLWWTLNLIWTQILYVIFSILSAISPYLIAIIPGWKWYIYTRYPYTQLDIDQWNDMMTFGALGLSVILISWNNEDSEE